MIHEHDLDTILDNSTDVVGLDGDKIGGVAQIFVNNATGAASFVTVRTGLFGMRETFVPLDDAEYRDGAIHVPFTAEQVKDAPQVDEGGAITPEDEDLIYSFYGVESGGGAGTAGGIDISGAEVSEPPQEKVGAARAEWDLEATDGGVLAERAEHHEEDGRVHSEGIGLHHELHDGQDQRYQTDAGMLEPDRPEPDGEAPVRDRSLLRRYDGVEEENPRLQDEGLADPEDEPRI